MTAPVSVEGSAPTRLLVCTTCRAEGEPASPPEARAGARLFRTLVEATAGDPGVELVPVECLSVCRRPCTVGFSAAGKWTYIYGDLPAETGASVILEALGLYAATSDGLIPWKQRPDAVKRGVVARLPPLPFTKGEPA